MQSETAILEITRAVRNYVDGVVEFDFILGESAWHPDGLKIALDAHGERLSCKTIRQTRPNLTAEEIGSARQQISQRGSIESVDRTGNAASVKLVWVFEKAGVRKRITDYILLLNSANGWRIVGKIFDEEALDSQ
ncbi:MAG: hypothetical protein AM326_01230 [Candidatus Thorarchaeota archaeon SMTZ-45]|nr:MAG: hypothetical protein AM326_01230 [Candidatus Thorarchaeota archaeon SMTZ-45]